MCVEDGEGEHQNKKDTCQPSCDGSEHVRGLGSENILGHATAERRPKSLALRPLHQNDEHHEERDDRLNYEQEIDQNGHGDGQYGQSRGFVHDEGAQERNLTTDFADFTDGKEDKTRIHRTGTLRWTQTLFTIPRPNMIMSANEPL